MLTKFIIHSVFENLSLINLFHPKRFANVFMWPLRFMTEIMHIYLIIYAIAISDKFKISKIRKE